MRSVNRPASVRTSTISFRWRHLSAVDDDDVLSDYVVERVSSYDLFDLSFAFDVNDNLTLWSQVAGSS